MLDYIGIFKRLNEEGVRLSVISIDDLVKTKQITDRQQDKADIRYLKELKNEKK